MGQPTMELSGDLLVHYLRRLRLTLIVRRLLSILPTAAETLALSSLTP